MIRKSTFAATIAKMFGTAAVAATLCAAPAAQAGVLNFEGYADNFVQDGSPVSVGKYLVETAGGGFGLIGNNDSCLGGGVACPVNNATTYFISADDSYSFVEMVDGSKFKISSLDASFVGFDNQSYPAGVAGLLLVSAWNYATGQVGATLQLALAGPANGAFNFATYNMAALGGGAMFDYVRLLAYACDTSGSCNRTTNQAQFALDNVNTIDASDVPEPGSFALLGLGLFGIGAVARRRKAAAI